MGTQPAVPFGALLKDYRLAAGLTQEALAERAGVSTRNIQNLERGENKPLKDTARRLADALRLAERERALLLTAVVPVPRPRAGPAPPAGPSALAPETALATGMLAVLVADVRGYTAYTHAHGDAAGALLATHFASLAEAAVQAAGGRVVEVRGDEVLAVFGSARSALRAATGILTRCAAETSDHLPLRAGIGLDVGEPVVVGTGYRGEVLNTAARLCAQAGPGEALASEAVVALARRVEGLSYADRGVLTLKGINRPLHAWLVQAAVPGTDQPLAAPVAMAPPAGGAATPPSMPRHNLPLPLSSFVGRAQEQERVRALLASHRLVTLSGSGGVGKTRLALAVAGSLRDTYADGIWLVELAPLADPSLVLSALADVLGLREESGLPLLQTLAGHLKERHVLLLLDNCEHLLPACAGLASSVLHACPHVRILATSREGLGVAGEQRYRVPSLSVPDPAHLPALELAGSYEAVRLFVERARERRDDFTLTPANASAITMVCARLDGVPLAIELAAARVGSMTVEAIAARLHDRFRLLSTGARDLPGRQRTLRAALDWSWELLENQERGLLARLSVFAGGWTLAAAEVVCAADDGNRWLVLDGLDALVGKSLAQVDESGDEAGRYRLLETVREYAAERLDERGEAAATRDRQLAWCVALAEEGAPHLFGSEQGTWLARLEREHDNLRAALGWARGRAAAQEGLRLAGALWRFWYTRGYVGEGLGWLDGAVGIEGGTVDARAGALNGAGALAWRQGAYGRAAALHEQGLALYRSQGNTKGIASTLNNLGGVAYQQGDYARAEALYEESLALRRTLDDQLGIAASLGNLGLVAIEQDNLGRAVPLLEESLTLQRDLGDKLSVAISLGNLGTVVHQQGDYRRAATLHEESLLLQRELEDKHGIAGSLINLGMAAYALGEHARATTLFAESVLLSANSGGTPLLAEPLEGLAWLAAAREQPARAARLAGSAEALREALGKPLRPGERGDYDRAVSAMREAMDEETFTAAWAAGRVMPLEAAIALALEDYPEITV